MTDTASIFLHRVWCVACDSHQLWFDPIDVDDVIVHCMDCGAEYLQTANGDHHRLPETDADLA